MADIRILNSWKEISSYIGRGVRTVQRWEELYGLPVHRAAGKDRSAVYALSDEVDAWLRLGKMHEQPRHKRDVGPEAEQRYQYLVESTQSLVERLRQLRAQSQEIRNQLAARRNKQAKVENDLREEIDGTIKDARTIRRRA